MADQQNNFQSNQNFAPDVVEMYKDFVTGGNTPNDNEPNENVGIDDLRGSFSITITGMTTTNLINALNIDPNSQTPSTPNTSNPSQIAQESRCHTFYRIIGFPIIAQDFQYYSPGLDLIKDANRQITLAKKIAIAENIDPNLAKLSQTREEYSRNTAKVFSVPESVEAGILMMMSGTYGNNNYNKRLFNLPFANNNASGIFNYATTNQTNPSSINSIYITMNNMSGDNNVLLNKFVDANNTSPNISITNPSVLTQHYHIITPFVVDPRIDFSIWSTSSTSSSNLCKRVAVPFVPNATYLKANSTSTAIRPLLEKVIIDRVTQNNNTNQSGQSVGNMVNYVKNNPNFQSLNIGSTLLSSVFNNNIFNLSQQATFAQYLSIIQAVMNKLSDSLNVVSQAHTKYYWLPQPSNLGPEGGSNIRPVPINSAISNSLITKDDFNIIYNQAQSLLSSVTSAISSSNSTVPDPGGFAFTGFFKTFDSSTSDSQGDLSNQTKTNLNDDRNALLTKAGNAMQVIEMIMGEFSGFGLCDIIAIMGALYVAPLTDLLDFLDMDAYNRAQNILGTSLPAQPNNIKNSMIDFAGYVSGFYQLMDQIFQDYSGNNALNL